MNTRLIYKKTGLLLLIFFILSKVSSAQETIVLRTDRDIYISGETLWIYVNCMEPSSNNPSSLSKVAYVELLDRQNIPVVQIKCKLENGQARIATKLPDSLSTGNYLLRGYTKWMRNYDEQFFAKKVISLINPYKVNSMPESEKSFSMDTIFIYPEGGKILAGVQNKLLIKSLDAYGKPVSLHGAILSANEDTISGFSTNRNGFGLLVLDVINSENYKLVYTSNGVKKTIDLAGIANTGYNLRISKQDDTNIIFKIYAPNLQNISNLHIDLTTLDGRFLGKYFFDDHAETKIAKFARNNEILNAVLMDENNHVLSGRFFKFDSEKYQSSLNLKLNKEKYQTRDQAILNIKNLNPAKGLKNISVTVARKCLFNDLQTFETIQRSDAYFNNLIEKWSDSIIDCNDFLLMVDVENQIIIRQNDEIFLPEINGEIISGKVRISDTNVPLNGEKMLLSVVGKSPIFELAKTDSSGRFYFSTDQFGKREIVIQPFRTDSVNSKYIVNLDPSFSGIYSKHSIGKFALSLDQAREINDAIVNMQVNSIYNLDGFNQIIENKPIPSEPFYHIPEYSVKIDKFIKLGSVEEIVKELVPLTAIRKQKGETVFKTIEDNNNYMQNAPTLSFVDGIPIRDVKRILDIAPSEIEKVDVVNLKYFVEDVDLGLLLMFYTVDGNLKAMDFDNRIFRQAWQFSMSDCNFNDPDYQNIENKMSKVPDFRNLLYFQTLQSLKDGEANFTFYTGDDAAIYTISVEGIKPDGSIEKIEIPLEVTD